MNHLKTGVVIVAQCLCVLLGFCCSEYCRLYVQVKLMCKKGGHDEVVELESSLGLLFSSGD